jgi:3-phosphoshikimate 1-carboxyvinyltransferase
MKTSSYQKFKKAHFMQITSSKLTAPVIIPTSKSYANRALILASLVPNAITIQDLPRAQDVEDCLEVLMQLGLAVRQNNQIVIQKQYPKDEIISSKIVMLFLGEGGTTIRFLIPMLALGKNAYLLKVNPAFKKRPYQELIDLLVNLGAKFTPSDREDELGLLQGPITLKDVVIDANETTQNASAFYLLQSVFDFKIEVKNLKTSLAYLEMTKKLVDELKSSSEYTVPVDMSSASYFIALGIFQGIEIANITQRDPWQADSKIFDILKQIGATYQLDQTGFNIVKQTQLKTLDIDLADCLDLAPTLAFMAAMIKGQHKLHNIQNLQFKETNRIHGIQEVLNHFGVKNFVKNTTLIIESSGRIQAQSQKIKTLHDHRLVMMASLFYKILGEGEVEPASAVNKSFPEFFDLINGINTSFSC